MHPHRETVSFITMLVMACGLVLGDFASPATAETIVVTTLTDTADPPFDADGICGTGTSATYRATMTSSRCARRLLPPTTPVARRPSPLPPA